MDTPRFIDRYFVCIRDIEKLSASTPVSDSHVRDFMKDFFPDNHSWAVGHTKVFMRESALSRIIAKQSELWKDKSIVLQSFFRRFYAMIKLNILREKNNAAISFQKIIRSFLSMAILRKLQVEFENKIRNITKVQSFFRRKFAQNIYRQILLENNCATILQNCIRRWAAMSELEWRKTASYKKKEEERRKLEEEKLRQEEELKREEEFRKELERKRREAEKRLEEERLREEEEERERKRKREEERRKREEEERKREAEEEEKRILEKKEKRRRTKKRRRRRKKKI